MSGHFVPLTVNCVIVTVEKFASQLIVKEGQASYSAEAIQLSMLDY